MQAKLAGSRRAARGTPRSDTLVRSDSMSWFRAASKASAGAADTAEGAEAAAREAELRKSLETARGHAAQELNDSKAFWQRQLARASEALQAAEAEAAAWREEAVALQEEVQHGIETCAYSADKAHLMLAEAVQRAEQEQVQMRASTEAL